MTGHLHNPSDLHPVLACSLRGVLAPNFGKLSESFSAACFFLFLVFTNIEVQVMNHIKKIFIFPGCKEAVSSVQHNHITWRPQTGFPLARPQRLALEVFCSIPANQKWTYGQLVCQTFPKSSSSSSLHAPGSFSILFQTPDSLKSSMRGTCPPTGFLLQHQSFLKKQELRH